MTTDAATPNTDEVDGIPSGDALSPDRVRGGKAMAWMRHTVPTAKREQKHLAVEHLRAMAADLVHCDTEACDPDELARLASLLDEARTIAASFPDHRQQPIPGDSMYNVRFAVRASAGTAAGDDAGLFERSPLTGRSNAIAMPLVMRYDPEAGLTRGHAIFGDQYEGPPGTVHGGFVVAAFDDVVGVAQVASGFAGKTARLAVDLRAPTPLNERIDYEAEVATVDGRKIWVAARSYHDGKLLAEAEGLLISMVRIPDRERGERPEPVE